MNIRSLVPNEPPRPVQPPMIYVKKELVWQYKHVIRNLKKENPLNEDELNNLGADGWEMTGMVEHLPLIYFYFKRQIEK